MPRSKFQRKIRKGKRQNSALWANLRLRRRNRVYDFRPHIVVLAFLLAFFALYQFTHISASGSGFEASAIASALSDAPQRNEGGVSHEEDPGALFSTSTVMGDGPVLSSVPSSSSVDTAATPQDSSEPKEESIPITFSNISLIGKAAVVVDTKTGEVLYRKNAKAQLPLASITKVISALVAENVFQPTDTIVLDANALQMNGDYGFTLGALWNYQDLLDYSLVVSSNDGITAIADMADTEEGRQGYFVKQMNEKAASLGLTQMFFLNPSGLDMSASTSGGYGSAIDVAALFQYVYKTFPHLLDATARATIMTKNRGGRTFYGENTDKLVGNVRGIIASKTGFTDLAGGNLAITWNAGLDHPVTAVVLGSTRSGRFNDMKKLIEATKNSFGASHKHTAHANYH